MITLDEFIAKGEKQFKDGPNRAFNIRSEYVKENGFSSLYVRYGSQFICSPFIEGRKYVGTLVLANMETKKKGKGTFTNLIKRLCVQYPQMNLFVECVIQPRFGDHLERIGFIKVDYGYGYDSSHYYLLGADHVQA